MPDINEWALSYDDKTFEFGTMADHYPFAVQVAMGDPYLATQDSPHPSSDGTVFGTDSLGGFTITFTITILPEVVPGTPLWTTALNRLSTFRAAWRADAVRRSPGVYAVLSSVERDRRVYGRPRRCSPTMPKIRKGLAGLVATFDTNDPNWYAETEKDSSVVPVPNSGTGFIFPVVPPFITAQPSNTTATLVNDGDLPAWPILEFNGPGQDLGFDLLDVNGHTLWSINLNDPIRYDEKIIVDTRPWVRGATSYWEAFEFSGTVPEPANGRVTGTPLELCTIPVGEFDYRFRVTDTSGLANAKVRWRDTYASW